MFNLLATKLRCPFVSSQRVQRLHLILRLNDGRSSGWRVTLLAAPPGFGKTTLLSDWAGQCQQPIAWVSLDENDNDPIRFWSYLITACQSVQTDVGDAALAVLHAPEPLPTDTLPDKSDQPLDET